jgi:hypothetical protein
MSQKRDMGHPFLGGADKKQIPGGNDRKKGNGKSKKTRGGKNNGKGGGDIKA